MFPSMDGRREWDLPKSKEKFILYHEPEDDLEDVKFYPYTKPGVDPIFAICNRKNVLICRPSLGKAQPLQVIQAIRDGDKHARNNSIAWSIDKKTGEPRICVAGGSTKIQIYNALSGKLLQSLVGHGGMVNDLVVSPINPQILASASADTTIRLWSLDAEHKAHPCVLICAGEAHRAPLMTIAFHPGGRYMLSGGDDRTINLWTLPELPDQNSGTKTPTLIHYPHFSSSEVHSDIVDCVQFHHDLILSKAVEEHCIVLWRIIGFSSSNTPPPYSSAPTMHDRNLETCSAFKANLPDSGPQFQRLLQFSAKDCKEIYMRFSLYSPISTSTDHPVLAMGNSVSKVFFWDLSRLEEYFDFITAATECTAEGASLSKPAFLKLTGTKVTNIVKPADNLSRTRREGSPVGSATSSMSLNTITNSEIQTSKSKWDERYATGQSHLEGFPMLFWDDSMSASDGELLIAPHKTETVEKLRLTARQCTWSPGGEWCVVGGSPNVVAVFWRWDGVVNRSETNSN